MDYHFTVFAVIVGLSSHLDTIDLSILHSIASRKQTTVVDAMTWTTNEAASKQGHFPKYGQIWDAGNTYQKAVFFRGLACNDEAFVFCVPIPRDRSLQTITKRASTM
jgi:hypothetical protein